MPRAGALRIGILGAGAVGCHVGGALAAGGCDVVFVGRERLKNELASNGLVATGQGGKPRHVVAAERLVLATAAGALADRDVVLCCVKSAQTAGAARESAPVLAPRAIVVSLQNGVRNADVLREALPAQIVLGGIVGFNVVAKGGGAFQQATSGPLVIEASSDPRAGSLVRALSAAGYDVTPVANIRPLQWSKLIMNLNNAVGALSDRPTKELVFSDGYRQILAALMEEALQVLRAAKVPTARLGVLPARLFPTMLRLPSPLLRLVAGAQVKIDPDARSSMWQDLTRGRLTEVDHLNGEVVRLAASCGARAPLNARIVEIVHEAEARAAGSPKLSAEALWSELTR